MKRTDLKRTTPLTPKPRKLGTMKPRAPIRTKRPAVAAAQYLQRRALSMRSGGRCEMETFAPAGAWDRCTNRATDPAHVYTRPKCGAARDLLAAVIHACRPCHEASGGHLATATTRIPLRYAQGAWGAILAYSRLGTDAEDRLRIHIGSVGPRPEKGNDPV